MILCCKLCVRCVGDLCASVPESFFFYPTRFFICFFLSVAYTVFFWIYLIFFIFLDLDKKKINKYRERNTNAHKYTSSKKTSYLFTFEE